jgi:hypothetical protein
VVFFGKLCSFMQMYEPNLGEHSSFKSLVDWLTHYGFQ